MMEDELVKIWQSSPNQERVKFEKSRLILDVQASINVLDRKIKYRDISEMAAVAIVVPAFSLMIYFVPNIISKIGAAIIVMWALYVSYVILRSRKFKPGKLSANYQDYLYKTREHLRVQVHLLRTVVYWYILPGFVGLNVIYAGFFLDSGNVKSLVRTEIILVGLAVALYIMNRNALHKTLLPRLRKIENLIEVMETP